MRVLVTGAAGFIGYHTTRALVDRGDVVFGIDDLNDYYDVSLKETRLALLNGCDGFQFAKIDIADATTLIGIFEEFKPERVINLAAQPGVRYSLKNPRAYIDSNVVGFLNVLEGCRHFGIEHLVYASSSSVYGANTAMPFSVQQNVDHPLSLYGATKKSNELMAHAYSHLYGLPTTGLRFFTVYGPWGRPDMSPFLFTRKILGGEPIEIFNNGQHQRDFTYIDDVVGGVVRTLNHVASPDENWNSDSPDPSTSVAPYRLYNIGNNEAVELMSFIDCLEKALGREAQKKFLPLQPGDVLKTYADIDALSDAVGFRPKTSIEDGVRKFVEWYLDYYGDDGAEH